MLCKGKYVISSMLAKQLIEKYNSQNARYSVEYMEMVLDEEQGIEVIGPRMLDMCQTGMPYTGMFIRFTTDKESTLSDILCTDETSEPEKVVLVQYLKLIKMHKDFCTVEVTWDDDPTYFAEYKEYKRN